MADYDVIVIGAGLGGLSAGAILAKQGRKVLVLEQADQVGGCCSSFKKDGYHFDVGASIFEAEEMFDAIFQALGSSLYEEVELLPCDPIYSTIYEDGSRLNIPTDQEATMETIAEIAPEDARNWPAYAKAFQRFIAKEGLADIFTIPMFSLPELIKWVFKNPRQAAALVPYLINSYEDVLNKYFKNEKVLESMAYQAYYFGLPPDLAPGLMGVLPLGEHLGITYPKGGMIAVPKALQGLGEKFGMEVQLGKLVTKVMVRNRRVEGVELEDGTQITSNLVVSNINAITLYMDLIGEEHLNWLARYGIKSYTPALSTPMLYLGLDYEPPLDAHHTLYTSSVKEIRDCWYDYYLKGLLPEKLFGLISWPTREDPSLSSKEGCHSLNIIITPSPYRLKGSDWDDIKQPLQEKIISYLDSYAVPGLADHVQVAEMCTPKDFERKLKLREGALYDIRADLTCIGFLRPSMKSRSIKGLYLVGVSPHVGGAPAAAYTGLVASDYINKYER